MLKNQDEQWLLKEKYGGVESKAFHADCARLAAGEPLGYVIGHVPFLDCTIHLDSRPLVPRPETEFWVEQAIVVMRGRAAAQLPRVLDLCAGSGAIGVAVAKAIPDAHVTFGEIDPTHLPTIVKNVKQNLIIYDTKRHKVVESDLFAHTDGHFDYILSNPPYIDPVLDRAEVSVKDFEPHLALYGGTAGMEVITRIIEGARAKLAPNTGQLWIEHEPEQTAAIATLAAAHGFSATTYLDQYGTDRYSVLTFAVAE